MPSLWPEVLMDAAHHDTAAPAGLPRASAPRAVFGREMCGDLDTSSRREWLLADGLGGYAMGTVPGLRTRRYHGLLVVATDPPGGRQLALAALDAVLVIGDRRVGLACHEWASGAVDPNGHLALERFALRDGLPSWRFAVGDVLLEVELAMAHGRAAVEATYDLLRAAAPVRLELGALCTWRDANGDRRAAGAPAVESLADGFVFERAYRVRGPGWRPAGSWYYGARYRVEAERGLDDVEDLFFAGTFSTELAAGDRCSVQAFAAPFDDLPPPGLAGRARARVRALVERAAASDDVERALVVASDRFVTSSPIATVAGYPWFGAWGRDTMVSYEGLYLETGRVEEGRSLLAAACASINGGLLVNDADNPSGERNSIDAPLWLLHAVGRHVARTGDEDLAAELADPMLALVERLAAGTSYGIGIDHADGLLRGGAPGTALTWMDARIGGAPVTPRQGKPVEVNALLVNGLATVALLRRRLGLADAGVEDLERRARHSFTARFRRPDGKGLYDVLDTPSGIDDATLRPNQLLAASLPLGPLEDGRVVDACWPLLTSLGPRSLDPADPAYLGRHRGDQAARDRAYHQGTVWPWLVGPLVEAAHRTGR
ncbi:MAG TPA: amylo-alpha-1,6-glucosidase, partial [Acidimicrobiales bacterium]|nr:amylo-alpha-1,6-glucosidase [Acidimicrobiales bacterium]